MHSRKEVAESNQSIKGQTSIAGGRTCWLFDLFLVLSDQAEALLEAPARQMLAL